MGELELLSNALQPVDRATGEWIDRGPDRLLTRMWTAFLEGGGDFLAGRRGTQLDVQDGVVRGLLADTGGAVESHRGRAVLLADGGFHSAPDLMARHISEEYLVRASRGSNQGDALRMGLEAGARAVNLEWFYGHCQSRDALRNERLFVFPALWPAIEQGVVVDGHGRRFVDEAVGDESVANAIARCATPGGCWVLLDRARWDALAGYDPLGLGSPTVNPDLERLGGTVVHAEDVDALSRRTGIPRDGLLHTFDELDLSATALVALPVIAGVTFTMGGLLVDEHARVLDHDDRPVPGLYAAGGAMGGLQGGPAPGAGYCGGWSEASTFGLLAAEHAALR